MFYPKKWYMLEFGDVQERKEDNEGKKKGRGGGQTTKMYFHSWVKESLNLLLHEASQFCRTACPATYYRKDFKEVSSLQLSQLKFFTHFSSLPCVLHATRISTPLVLK
jgi:hypothetical protein